MFNYIVYDNYIHIHAVRKKVKNTRLKSDKFDICLFLDSALDDKLFSSIKVNLKTFFLLFTMNALPLISRKNIL